MNNMNPIMRYYTAVLTYLNADVRIEGAAEMTIILALAEETAPTWKATEESLKALEQIVNRPTELSESEYNESTLEADFVTAAFKDLSVLKNPAAMGLFVKIRDRIVFPDDMFVWARTAKRRPDGSAVVILHVSDYDKFVHIMENCNMSHAGSVGARALEDCVVIGA